MADGGVTSLPLNQPPASVSVLDNVRHSCCWLGLPGASEDSRSSTNGQKFWALGFELLTCKQGVACVQQDLMCKMREILCVKSATEAIWRTMGQGNERLLVSPPIAFHMSSPPKLRQRSVVNEAAS